MSDPFQVPRSINVCAHCGLDFRIFTTSDNAQLGVELARLRRVNAELVEENNELREILDGTDEKRGGE